MRKHPQSSMYPLTLNVPDNTEKNFRTPMYLRYV